LPGIDSTRPDANQLVVECILINAIAKWCSLLITGNQAVLLGSIFSLAFCQTAVGGLLSLLREL